MGFYGGWENLNVCRGDKKVTSRGKGVARRIRWEIETERGDGERGDSGGETER